MSLIFISHSSRNDEVAVQLRDWLLANGWDDVFLDLDPAQGLAPGERWQNCLKEAAYRCEAVIFLISHDWLNSRWCLSEYLLAKQLGKRLFPVIIGDIDLTALPADMTADHQVVNLAFDPQGWERLKQGLKRAGLDANSFTFPVGRRPYPGFEPLTEDDAAIFFGRDAHVLRGLDRLRLMRDAGAERALVVLGASGAGKSSFLRAGLWPRLRRDDRNFWPLPVIRPDRGVLTGRMGLYSALESAMSDERLSGSRAIAGLPRSRSSLGQIISRDGLGKVLAAIRLAATRQFDTVIASSPTLVLCLDQTEELFNEEDRTEAECFLDMLADALRTDRSLIAVICIRSDGYPRLQSEPKLAGISREPFDLPPMLEGSLRSVIEGPAALVVPPLKIQPALVDALLNDSSGQDALPLLAFTLDRMVREYGAEGSLTLEQYQSSDGVRGAIITAVDEALRRGRLSGSVPVDGKAVETLLRQAFVPHLARVNEDGEFARRVAIASEIPDRAKGLVDLLVEARLLTRDRSEQGEIIEVAHEALLREWPLLRKFLEADREFLSGKRQLAEDLNAWQSSSPERKNEFLLSGFRLTRARHWLAERSSHELTAAECNFIKESVLSAGAAQRRRKVNAIWLASSMMVAVPLVFWIYGWLFPALAKWEARQAAMYSTEDPTPNDISSLEWRFARIAFYQRFMPAHKAAEVYLTSARFGQLDLRGISFPAANFIQTKFSNVQFDGANLANSFFSESPGIANVDFARANLSYANFRSSTLTGQTSFEDANLYRANFDYTNLCGVNFSGARLKKASFRDVHLEDVTGFANSGWWLASGWNSENYIKLMAVEDSEQDIMSSAGFQADLAETTEFLLGTTVGTIDRAMALNSYALALASWGFTSPADALATYSLAQASNCMTNSEIPQDALTASQESVCILENTQQQVQHLKSIVYDTLGYLQLQRNDIDGALASFANSEADSSRIGDGGREFRLAVALYASGHESEALAKLHHAMAVQSYVPEQELKTLQHLLVAHNGKPNGLLKQVLVAIDSRWPRSDRVMRCSPP